VSWVIAVMDRASQQRIDALARANHVRHWRAQLKRELRTGRRLSPLLRKPPAELLSAEVWSLIVCIPSIGRIKAFRVLRHCRIGSTLAVNELSDRQRTALLEALKGR
jgi:hypothetical protein